MYRSHVFYLFLFLIFLVVSQGEACEKSATVPDAASAHACCAAGDGEDPPAAKVPASLDGMVCHGSLCCCHSGGIPVSAPLRTAAGDHQLVLLAPEVLHYGTAVAPEIESSPRNPSFIRLLPLYLRNCAFLI